jgi:outer membrane usher protein
MSAEVDSIEADAVPAWRSVARVQFPVRGGRGALIKIEFDDGEPAPAGATVRLPGEDREFYVARRGEAYVTGLQASNELELRWRDHSCRFGVELPSGDADNIARVGPVRCTGVKR